MPISAHRVLQVGPLKPSLAVTLRTDYQAYSLPNGDERDAFLAEHAAEITAVVVSGVTRVDPDLMAALPNLKVVVNFGVGYDNIDVDAAAARGIGVSNTPGVLDDCVADTAVGLLIDTMRRFSAADRYVRAGRWPVDGNYPLTQQVSGSNVGILGLGRIGGAIATRLTAFGCSISYHNRRQVPDSPYRYLDSPVELARQVEVLVVAAAGGAGTRHLVDREVLDALGSDGYLVNVARGTVVDQDALVEALTSRPVGRCWAGCLRRRTERPRRVDETGQRGAAAPCRQWHRGNTGSHGGAGPGRPEPVSAVRSAGHAGSVKRGLTAGGGGSTCLNRARDGYRCGHDVPMDDLVHGHCDDRFHAVRDALADAIAAGEEAGAAIAIDIGGVLVADMWGGHADAARTRAWDADTIVNVFSSTKTVTALAGLMLIDRGLITADARVADYWPEFAANGKQDIEFRHLLTHSSGLSGWDQPFTIEESYDWEKSTAALAAQAPWWEPGTASGYHALTHGHLIGEVVRRVTGKSLKDFVREEISEPLGADFQIGAGPGTRTASPTSSRPTNRSICRWTNCPRSRSRRSWGRRHRQSRTAPPGGPPTSVRPTDTAMRDRWSGSSRRSRWAARWTGCSCCGPETVESIFELQLDGPDVVLLGHPLRWGLGFGLPQTQTVSYVPDGKICFWGGWGGSWETCSPDHPRHVRLRDEQDGAGRRRFRAHRPLPEPVLRGSG